MLFLVLQKQQILDLKGFDQKFKKLKKSCPNFDLYPANMLRKQPQIWHICAK